MKAGWKTSEFWMSILGVILPGLASVFTSSGDPKMLAIGAAVSGAYSIARAGVKVAADVRAAAEAKAGVVVDQRLASGVAAAHAHPVPGSPSGAAR